jgi:hypothetical protein
MRVNKEKAPSRFVEMGLFPNINARAGIGRRSTNTTDRDLFRASE